MRRNVFISRFSVVCFAFSASLTCLPTSMIMAKNGCPSSSGNRGYVTRSASRLTVVRGPATTPATRPAPALSELALPQPQAVNAEAADVQAQIAELSRRLDQHVERCKEKAEVAESKQGNAELKVSEHAKSIDSSQRLIVFARNLLSKNETTIQVGEKEFTQEQIGSLLATLVDEHQKLIAQGRELRIEAAAAAAESEGADKQLARWKQQQVELERIVDALINANAGGGTQGEQASVEENIKLAQDLATRLETLLPPPTPVVSTPQPETPTSSQSN